MRKVSLIKQVSVIFLFLSVIRLFLPSSILAKCLPAAQTSDCTDDADCLDNYQSILGNNCPGCKQLLPAGQRASSCCEYVGSPNDMTFCFISGEQPTATPAPCGTSFAPCCPAPNYCITPLVPDSGGAGGQCICRNPNAPIPTAAVSTPFPTGSISCDADGTNGVVTSIGCIPVSNINSFAAWMIGKLIYVAVGLAFILLVYGAFQITTAQGDTKKVQAGSELISSTIAGILFIILSLLILKIVGIDILKIPGFGQ